MVLISFLCDPTRCVCSVSTHHAHAVASDKSRAVPATPRRRCGPTPIPRVHETTGGPLS